MSTDKRTNDQLREIIRSNQVWVSRTENDDSLSEDKKRQMIDAMQALIDGAYAELNRRRESGEHRGHEKVDVKDRVLAITFAVYAFVVVGAIALAPVTGGRSLAAIAVVVVVGFIHGLLYATFS